jgi:hypothetical protein
MENDPPIPTHSRPTSLMHPFPLPKSSPLKRDTTRVLTLQYNHALSPSHANDESGLQQAGPGLPSALALSYLFCVGLDFQWWCGVVLSAPDDLNLLSLLQFALYFLPRRAIVFPLGAYV